MAGRAVLLASVAIIFLSVLPQSPAEGAVETLVIAASPSMKAPIEALGQAFEKLRPDVRVRVYYDSGLDLRRTIAAIGNDPRFFLGTGPVDLVAPGGDELITRLESKSYILPGTARPYVEVPLVLVVPAALVEAPESFEALGQSQWRIAIADPDLTELGRQTQELFQALGLEEDVKGRLDIASDARGVLDHLLLGQADVGVIFGPDAVVYQERIRRVALAGKPKFVPTVHSMAMNRYCRNRAVCGDFLSFLGTPEAHGLVRSLGYLFPAGGSGGE